MLVRPLLLKQLIDKVLQVKTWLSWEPETLEAGLNSAGVPELAKYKKDELFTNLVDSIRAILSKESMALMDWHIFENVVTIFSGRAPDFFETTPPETHDMFFAIKFLEDFFPDLSEELSEEVLSYIGSLFITRGILVHLHPVINSAIDLTIKLNDFDLKADQEAQRKTLTSITGNSKLIKAMSAAIINGGEGLDVSDKAGVEVRRALQILTTYITLEHMIKDSAEGLKTFLKDTSREISAPITKEVDSERASKADEHIDNRDNTTLDEEVIVALNSERPSVTQHVEEADELVIVDKLAEALPGLAGFNYHAGQLYNVTGEVGHDDVPRSTLVDNKNKGDVIYKGSSNGKFTTPSSSLKILGRDKPKDVDPTNNSSPTDSSLELAEI